jgi:hypothetical protein
MQHVLAPSIASANVPPRRLGAALAYWVPTALVVLNATGGGLFDALRAPSGMVIFHHLGYPDYFATLLGTAKVLGGLALIVPVPRTLREWAYAGLVFDAISAAISIAAVGDPPTHLVIPAVFVAITIASFRAWRGRAARSERAAAAVGTPS